MNGKETGKNRMFILYSKTGIEGMKCFWNESAPSSLKSLGRWTQVNKESGEWELENIFFSDDILNRLNMIK